MNIFEDGHSLLPASEYFRGELPYRDIVPGHGLVSDGLLAFVQLRVFGDDVGGLKRGEKVCGALFWPGFYAIGYAATGSPAFALGGLLFSFFAMPQYQNPRAIVALWLLALALYASRSKRRVAWLAFGAAVPLGLCVAVEFTFYSACAGAVALWVARGRRLVHLGWMAFGAAASSAAIALCFLALGILPGFLRTTFLYVPSLLPVYAQGLPALHRPRGGAAQWLALFGDETALLYGFTAVSLVLLGAYLPQAPRVGPRSEAAAAAVRLGLRRDALVDRAAARGLCVHGRADRAAAPGAVGARLAPVAESPDGRRGRGAGPAPVAPVPPLADVREWPT